MRKRSESFYTKSFEEFTSLTESITKVKTKRKTSKLSNKLNNLKINNDENHVDGLSNDFDDDLGYKLEKSSEYDEEDNMQLGASGAFKMTVYEKYAIEEDEDYLIGSLANINESIRSKDKNLFLENISNFYHKNIRDYNDKNIQKIKEIKERQIKFQDKKENKTNNTSNEKLNNSNINNINNSHEESSKIARSFSFQSVQNLDVNFNDIAKKFDILSINSKCSTLSSNFYAKSPANFFINDPILSQNILQAQATIKILIVGDSQVGKSFFVNKFLKKEVKRKEYVPTDSLEISKSIIYIVNKSVKLEVYDTNKQILESQLFKTYTNICDCFILIFDPTIKESIVFIEEKLREIKKQNKSPDVLLIGNIRFIDCNDDEVMLEKNKQFKENDIYVKRLIEESCDKIHYIDIKNLDNFKKIIKKFLIMTFLKKRNSNNSRKSKFNSNSRTASTSISVKKKNVNISENKFDSSVLDNSSKKIFKSLSFHLSEGDDIYE